MQFEMIYSLYRSWQSQAIKISFSAMIIEPTLEKLIVASFV